MKRCPLMLIFLTMFTTFAVSQGSKNITVRGIVRDLKTKIPLTAQITIIYKDAETQTKEINNNSDGSFEINALPKQLILQAKSNNYIVSNVLINFENLENISVVCDIPLLFDSKSKNNQLYLQFAAQKKSTDSVSKSIIPKNTQVFQAIDALDGHIIPAQFRLTNANKMEVINVKTGKENSVFEHNFTQKDNIVVEVTADGYQNFLSNIVINTFDETVHENTAKLVKKLSFLNLIIKKEENLSKIEVIETSQSKPISLLKKEEIHLGNLSFGSKYKITVSSKNALPIIKEFEAIEGLNQVIVSLEPKTKIIAQVETKLIQIEKQAFKPESKVVNLETQSIFFDQSSTVLKQESKQLLEQISKKMLEAPDIKIEITGHTDNIGDSRQNLYLSEFRAKVISNFLFNKGIKDKRITLRGDDSKQANAGNDTEENRQKNRRAELRFY